MYNKVFLNMYLKVLVNHAELQIGASRKANTLSTEHDQLDQQAGLIFLVFIACFAFDGTQR